MSYEMQADGQILTVEEIATSKQTAIVRQHHTWGTHIIASWDPVTGTLRAEYRRPTIDGTEWQGQMVDAETRPMLLTVDDSEPVEITAVAGVAEEALVFEAPGTYALRVSAAFGCEPAMLEVVIA